MKTLIYYICFCFNGMIFCSAGDYEDEVALRRNVG